MSSVFIVEHPSVEADSVAGATLLTGYYTGDRPLVLNARLHDYVVWHSRTDRNGRELKRTWIVLRAAVQRSKTIGGQTVEWLDFEFVSRHKTAKSAVESAVRRSRREPPTYPQQEGVSGRFRAISESA